MAAVLASCDLAVVGGGIVGLAHALAAARRGLSVVIVDRDAQANGASIRNFGFVTVNGQQAGRCWTAARRARDVWAQVAEAAGIAVLHRGMLVTARLPEAEAVIDAFLTTDMAEGCRRLTGAQAAAICPAVRADRVTAALHSPHELRVESRQALPKIAAWLAAAHGVRFLWSTAARAVGDGVVETDRGAIRAQAVVVCPGDDLTTLFPDRIAARAVTRCKLQMLRVAPGRPVTLGAAVMSDLGLARYLGYAELQQAAALKARLDAEQAAARENGVHLIVVQSADGSLVVGDSHHYAPTPDPFGREDVDAIILDEMDAVLDLGARRVTERWIGTYASAADWLFEDAPDARTRLVIVTAGCGASTAFALGEDTVAGLFGA
jgi:FAD dependent oxidoreductase TIGR03364